MVSNEALKEYLHQHYYHDNGNLRRRFKQTRWGKDLIVGALDKDGYKTLYILGKRYKVHRLIFLMEHGYLSDLIDHANGEKSKNDIANLVESTKSLNAINLGGPHRDNRSGYLGVTHRRDTDKYSARFRNKNLGCFKTPQEAFTAYVDARTNEGFTTRAAK